MAQRNKGKRQLQRMESQEINDYDTLIEKKKIEKWKAVVAHAIKHKTNFRATLSFTDVDKNEVSMDVKADKALLAHFWNCVDEENDDEVIAFNEIYYKMKFNTEQIIEYRRARGTHIKVRDVGVGFRDRVSNSRETSFRIVPFDTKQS